MLGTEGTCAMKRVPTIGVASGRRVLPFNPRPRHTNDAGVQSPASTEALRFTVQLMDLEKVRHSAADVVKVILGELHKRYVGGAR
jgi:hypothetical protein